MRPIASNQIKFSRAKLVLGLTIIGLHLISVEKSAIAEGSRSFGDGANGVNRVVRTYSFGYAEISGDCSVTMHLPRDRNGGFTRRVLDHTDKPSFYLGGEAGNDEFDGGLQYEGATRAASVPGWAAFISYNTDFTNPQRWVVDANGIGRSTSWRAGTGDTTYQQLRFSFYTAGNQGVVALAVSGLSSYGDRFYWTEDQQLATSAQHLAPYVGDDCWDITRSSVANVKRVTAMTRDNGDSDLDGSWLQSDWRNCIAYRYIPNNPVEVTPLTREIVHPLRTGYDSPGGRGAGAYDRNGNVLDGASPKVEFPRLNISSDAARAEGTTSEQATLSGVSRYTQEDVNIWLRDPLPLKRGR